MLFRKLINQKRDNNTFIDSRFGLDRWSEYVKKFAWYNNKPINYIIALFVLVIIALVF